MFGCHRFSYLIVRWIVVHFPENVLSKSIPQSYWLHHKAKTFLKYITKKILWRIDIHELFVFHEFIIQLNLSDVYYIENTDFFSEDNVTDKSYLSYVLFLISLWKVNLSNVIMLFIFLDTLFYLSWKVRNCIWIGIAFLLTKN